MNEVDRRRWRLLRDSLVFSGLLALAFWVLVPGLGDEVRFFFLSVASSSFLPIPHEPILLYYARLIPDPLVVGLLSGAGAALVAGVDYQAVGQVLRLDRARAATQTRFFRAAVRGFSIAPSFTTWLFFLLPLPDYPIRVLAPASGMPLWRYIAAVGLGRAPRGWALAVLGHEVPFPWWSLVLLGLAIVLVWALPFMERRREPYNGPRG